MLNDIDFIAESVNSNPSLKQHGSFGFSDPFFSKHPGDAAFKRAGAAATLIVLDAIQRNKYKDKEEKEQESQGESPHQTTGALSIIPPPPESQNSPLPKEFRKQRRTGVNDVYKSNLLGDEIPLPTSPHETPSHAPRAVYNRAHSIEASVVFRARKLYHRGKKLGTGSYASVRSLRPDFFT